VDDRRRLPAFVQRFPITAAALAYAEHLHAGQTRAADGADFIEHPLEVATLLYEAGAPDDVVAAGVLHDTLEKTEADAAALRPRFGDRITNLVLAVTEDDRIGDFAARKAALVEQVAQAGPEAQMVFAADKVSKVRELRLKALDARVTRARSYGR
jgi:(p)ppGpp synthase/HD superfamily hydrolase